MSATAPEMRYFASLIDPVQMLNGVPLISIF